MSNFMSNYRTWCPGNPDCDDPKMLCQDLVDDYHAFQVLFKCKKEIRNCTIYNFPLLGAQKGISGQIHVSRVLFKEINFITRTFMEYLAT